MSPGKILSQYKEQLGDDYQSYLNHVKRVYSYACMLRLERESDLLLVAAVFHDLDLWVSETMDYLNGSVSLSHAHVDKNNLALDKQLLSDVISLHHKLTKIKRKPEAEAFRKADLIDLTSGCIHFNIPRSIIVDTERRHPRLGFTKTVIKKTLKWSRRHPLNPLPMVKI